MADSGILFPLILGVTMQQVEYSARLVESIIRREVLPDMLENISLLFL